MFQNQIEMVIRLTPHGRIELSGPLEHRLLCYGLLEAGKDALRAMNDTPKIIPVLKPIEFNPPGQG